jgi:hypothetical protein
MKVDQLINDILNQPLNKGLIDELSDCKVTALNAQIAVTRQDDAYAKNQLVIVVAMLLRLNNYTKTESRQIITNMVWIANRKFDRTRCERELYILNRHLFKQNFEKALRDAVQALAYIAFESQDNDLEE